MGKNPFGVFVPFVVRMFFEVSVTAMSGIDSIGRLVKHLMSAMAHKALWDRDKIASVFCIPLWFGI